MSTDPAAPMTLDLPYDLHPETAKAVLLFAEALGEKLAAAQRKYGYTDGWAKPDWEKECRAEMLDHVQKGDPRDVAAYCMFMWRHGWSTSGEAAERQEDALRRIYHGGRYG